MPDQTVHILLVEDDEIAAEKVRRAFRKAGPGFPIHLAKNGIQALDLLRGTNGREKLPRPNIILLDLRMPMMDGLDFLETLRKDSKLGDSVVFVLTTSNAPQDVQSSYKYQVAGFIQKPRVSLDGSNLVGLMKSYCSLVDLP